MEKEIKSCTSINVMRFIAATMIVMIHTTPFSGISQTLSFFTSHVLCRVAVPFFFMTTGYFCGDKYFGFLADKETKEGKSTVFKYLKRVLGLYLFWSVIYGGIRLMALMQAKNLNRQSIFSLGMDFLFRGTYFHLWYLQSLLITAMLVSFLGRHKYFKMLGILSFLSYGLGLMGDSYHGLMNKTGWMLPVNLYELVFGCTRNGICFALLFIFLGAWIKQKHLILSWKKGIVLNILLLAAMTGEAALISHLAPGGEHNMYILLVPLSVVFFLSVLDYPARTSVHQSDLLKKMSLVMYCVHPLVMMTGNRILVGFEKLKAYFFLRFLFVWTGSFLISCIVCLIRSRLCHNGDKCIRCTRNKFS